MVQCKQGLCVCGGGGGDVLHRANLFKTCMFLISSQMPESWGGGLPPCIGAKKRDKQSSTLLLFKLSDVCLFPRRA